MADAASDADAAPEVSLVGTLDDTLRLNHIQTLGTHNSYHLRSETVIHESHDYDHRPLDEQLDLGVRAFEIDVHNPEDRVDADDFAVYHISWLDEVTTCLSFRACLTTIKMWSDAHPMHVPIAIWIEPKGDAGGGTIPDIQRLDTVIASVFPDEQVFTPADLKASYGSLRERLDSEGWPTLGELRGQVLFAMLDTGDDRTAYTDGLTTAHDRLMFVGANSSEFGEPWAAVAKINNPGSETIPAAHEAQVLVASNLCLAGEPDANTCDQNTQDANTIGSQWLKTDFPEQAGNLYWFHVPPRCNPATAPETCVDAAIE